MGRAFKWLRMRACASRSYLASRPATKGKGDARPTTVDDDALRATIGDVPLLACERVQTPLQRRLEPLEMMLSLIHISEPTRPY